MHKYTIKEVGDGITKTNEKGQKGDAIRDGCEITPYPGGQE